jgi:type IV secretion system protein VirB4
MSTLWPFFGSVAAAAALGGGIAIPAARTLMLGTQNDWFCDELDLDRILEDRQTVVTKAGTLFRVIQVIGESYETKPVKEQVALLKGRTQMLNQLGELGLTLRWFGVKRRRAMHHDAQWPSAVLKDIGDAEAALFAASFTTHWYVLVGGKDARALDLGLSRALPMLSPYREHILTAAEGDQPCELTGFLNFLVSGELRDDLPRLSANLSGSLPGADAQFSADGGFTVSVPHPVHHRVIVVRSWPELIDGEFVGKVLALPCEVDLLQVCRPENQTATKALMNRNATAASGLFGSQAAAADYATALDQLGSGQCSWTTQYFITLRHPDKAELEELARRVGEILAQRRILYSVETKGAPAAWLNRLPDHNTLLRPVRLFSEPVAAMWPMPFSPVGRHASPWGDGPIRMFSTSAGNAYSFQFHIAATRQSLGNFLIIGGSGAGKSTLISHLFGGATKHEKVKAFIFDSGEGTRFAVEAMGGLYQNYDALALNPLAVAEDTRQGRHRLYLWLASLLGDVSADPASGAVLDTMVSTVMQLPADKRSLSALVGVCAPLRTPQRRVLADWIVDDKGKEGRYAHIFNGTEDSLAGLLSSAPLVGINLNEVLEDPVLAPPVVMHLIETIIQTAGRGYGIFVDEAANLLGNPIFKEEIKDVFREIRKKDGLVGLAFQDPGDLEKSGIASVVLRNTATMMFFPNPGGEVEDYEFFGLNEEQKDFIFNSPPGLGRRVLVVRRDGPSGYEESVILDVDLGHLGGGSCLKYFRSGPQAVKEMIALQATWGDQWASHL